MILFLNKFKKLKEDKRGTMAIEIVVGMLMFLLVLCFFLDITIITWKFSVISQTNTYLARTAGLQGGIRTSAPTGYPGGNDAYASSSEVYKQIQENFKSAGINDNEYTVKINGTKLRSNSNVAVDYLDNITTYIEVDYKWDLVSNFIPGDLTNSITSKRAVISEFKYRYDSWIGE
ncbi:MAG: hypothetical protein K0R54_66 [Clostridiaceae bacterium]|jgi:hypothetical protein|nr:hypothetical protein [Clostridiaceae bacterium]